MPPLRQIRLLSSATLFFLGSLIVAGSGRLPAQGPPGSRLVNLEPFDVDSKNPDRKQFGALTLLSAFQLQSKDRRFGGLSGLSIGQDGKLYAVSDAGYWLSATIVVEPDGALKDLRDWQIAPLLMPDTTPVRRSWVDAEALAQSADGSFLVGFEGRHRIWRYSPPPATIKSTPILVPTPDALARAPINGGIEALASLPDGKLLMLTEDFANSDGSLKGWLSSGGRFAEISYVPARGYSVTDCAVLSNGDVIVLERRYRPLAIFSVRLALVDQKDLRAGAKLTGKELLRLEQPLAVENFEAVAVQRTTRGTVIYLVSDDNYNPFQQTLLLQFLLPDSNH
jgi:hypothetical protein